MFESYDRALQRALTSENFAFGRSDRSLALATARRAAAENRVKALNEASLGNVRFASIHETASTRCHEDAEAMAQGRPPLHSSISTYLTTAEAYRKLDAVAAPKQSADVVPLTPRRTSRTAA